MKAERTKRGDINKLRYIFFFALAIGLLIAVFIFFFNKGCETDIPKSKEDGLLSWTGNYVFSESSSEVGFAPMVMDYSINIYSIDNIFYANIEIVGQSTWAVIKAKVYGNKEWISLVFLEDLQDNKTFAGKPNDVLLSFRKEETDILTYWGKIEPMLYENEVSGNLYFTNILD